MDDLIAAGLSWPAAIAVSGGADSVALMHLAAAWSKSRQRFPPFVVTVDHGLQKNSARDAKTVHRWARQLGLKAHTLSWTGPKPKADIEAEAREARYRLIGGWMSLQNVRSVCLAHTRDDQGETFLLRLARGSGLDGLAAMRPLSAFPLGEFRRMTVARPLLSFERERLRDHLERLKQPWLEDPMNADLRFRRAELRHHRPVLEGLGLTASRLADTANHLSRAREALDEVTVAVLARTCRLKDGSALLEREAIVAAPREVALRALAQILMVVSGNRYRPRFERLERVFAWLEKGDISKGCTLHGCFLERAPKRTAIFGEETIRIVPEPPRRTRKHPASK
jgi:tRNA(Ile)-lysidine synthase